MERTAVKRITLAALCAGVLAVSGSAMAQRHGGGSSHAARGGGFRSERSFRGGHSVRGGGGFDFGIGFGGPVYAPEYVDPYYGYAPYPPPYYAPAYVGPEFGIDFSIGGGRHFVRDRGFSHESRGGRSGGHRR